MQRIKTNSNHFVNLPTKVVEKLALTDTFKVHFLRCETIEPKDLNSINLSAPTALLILSMLIKNSLPMLSNEYFSTLCKMYESITRVGEQALFSDKKEADIERKKLLKNIPVIFKLIPGTLSLEIKPFDITIHNLIILSIDNEVFSKEINSMFELIWKSTKFDILIKMILLYIADFYLVTIGLDFSNLRDHFNYDLTDIIETKKEEDGINYYFDDKCIQLYLNNGQDMKVDVECDGDLLPASINIIEPVKVIKNTNVEEDLYYENLQKEYEDELINRDAYIHDDIYYYQDDFCAEEDEYIEEFEEDLYDYVSCDYCGGDHPTSYHDD
jgi:hypothetical protein